jgi:hypothetical protein
LSSVFSHFTKFAWKSTFFFRCTNRRMDKIEPWNMHYRNRIIGQFMTKNILCLL